MERPLTVEHEEAFWSGVQYARSFVFRRVTGLTPGTTRRLLGEPAAPVVQGGMR